MSFGKPFQKGISGNPEGRPSLPARIRSARRANQARLIELVMTCFARTASEMRERKEAPDLAELEREVMGLMAEASSDVAAFKYLTELVCGKIPETDVETAAEQMSPQEKLEILRRAISTLEQQVKSDGSG